LSHQTGKKPKKQNKLKTKTQQNIQSSNAVLFQQVFQHEVVVQSLSHQRKRKGKKKTKRVWRLFCECLTEAVAHLPATVSLLLLEALMIADLRSELNTYLAPQALFI
jgi:hypothetical protein